MQIKYTGKPVYAIIEEKTPESGGNSAWMAGKQEQAQAAQEAPEKKHSAKKPETALKDKNYLRRKTQND